KSGSIATLAIAFLAYTANFFPGVEVVILTVPVPLGPGGGPLEIRYAQLVAAAVIGGLAYLNYFGVKLGGRVQIALTASKVGLILAIVVIGLGSGVGQPANLSSSIPAPGGFTGFFAALVAALWAYDGWNNVAMVGSEVRSPQ